MEGNIPGQSFKFFFLFLALAAILFNGAEGFQQFLEGHPRNLNVKLFPNQCTG